MLLITPCKKTLLTANFLNVLLPDLQSRGKSLETPTSPQQIFDQLSKVGQQDKGTFELYKHFFLFEINDKWVLGIYTTIRPRPGYSKDMGIHKTRHDKKKLLESHTACAENFATQFAIYTQIIQRMSVNVIVVLKYFIKLLTISCTSVHTQRRERSPKSSLCAWQRHPALVTKYNSSVEPGSPTQEHPQQE